MTEFIEICGKHNKTHKTICKYIIRKEEIIRITDGHLKYPMIWWKGSEYMVCDGARKHLFLSQEEYQRIKKILC